MSKLDILRRSCGIASAQPAVGQHYCVRLVPGNALGHSVSGPWPAVHSAIVLFVAAFKSGFHPRPLHSFTSARPGRRAKPTLATPQTLSVDCQCLATVTVTVSTEHFENTSHSFSPFNIKYRKKGFWCFVNSLCFVDFETDMDDILELC